MIEAMTTRAEHWRSHELRLPRGVQVVPMLDDERTVYSVDWGREPPPARRSTSTTTAWRSSFR